MLRAQAVQQITKKVMSNKVSTRKHRRSCCSSAAAVCRYSIRTESPQPELIKELDSYFFKCTAQSRLEDRAMRICPWSQPVHNRPCTESAGCSNAIHTRKRFTNTPTQHPTNGLLAPSRSGLFHTCLDMLHPFKKSKQSAVDNNLSGFTA